MMEKEKRLIDAHALMENLERYVNPMPGERGTGYLSGLATAMDEVEAAPRADAVEVVRCKDCKHWHEETGWCDHHSWFIEEDGEPCHPWESNNWKMLMEDDFCSYGERKDNA